MKDMHTRNESNVKEEPDNISDATIGDIITSIEETDPLSSINSIRENEQT